jgi:hypothetical protein
MTLIVLRALKVAVPVTIAAAIAALTSAGAHALVLDIYLLTMTGILLLALVRMTRALAPTVRTSQFDRALDRMRRGPPESGEPTLARDVALASTSALHFHIRLRPVLREVATHRLRVRYGVELDSEPARARELLGAAAWDAVRPDRPPPEDRLGPGPSTTDLREIVEELERC